MSKSWEYLVPAFTKNRSSWSGRRLGMLGLGAVVAAVTTVAAAGLDAVKLQFSDVLDAPALMSHRAPRLETISVAHAGQAMVAVGARGVILRSEDGGAHWLQMPTPVGTDLVSVYFLDARKGWAVGHDAVILHTEDAGQTWVRQFDGRQAVKVLQASYAKLAQAGEVYAAGATAELDRQLQANPKTPALSQPLLDIWFANESEGYAAGAFNMLFHTADGGKTWEAWDHLVDNPKAFHLNAVRGGPAGLVIVGEQGLVLHWNDTVKRFQKVDVGYGGSFFGIVNEAHRLMVYGLRGNARVSLDGGGHWSSIKIDTVSSVVNAFPLDKGRLLYVLQDGLLTLEDAEGALHLLQPGSVRADEVYSAMLLDGHTLVTTGLRGPQVTELTHLLH